MSKKPIIRYIRLTNGRCGLTTDTPMEAVRRIGSENLSSIGNATADQIAWIRAMGGNVPDGRIVKARNT